MNELAMIDFEMDQRESIEYLHELYKDIHRGNTYCVKYVKKYELNNVIKISEESRAKIYNTDQ
ncbi:hypothetical protein A3Q56_03506 [Intoshia linei]|uniref:Uncharacterized protein n=1 Tax=Intoshia linei TaxID=1819745 RepID=A0A177B387_9BILA|nr:hypothetical protein A3Q56_03506 [Intoshia linei]